MQSQEPKPQDASTGSGIGGCIAATLLGVTLWLVAPIPVTVLAILIAIACVGSAGRKP